MSGELDGRMALVTGASSGIGRAVARRFARAGAAVACSGRNQERVQRTVSEVEADGGTAHGIVADLATPEGAEQTVEQAVERLGGLDILINNAGIDATEWRPVHEWPIEEWDRLINGNLRSPFLVAKFAIPHLRRSGGGDIVHMSSVCAITVWDGDVGYDVAKAGLNMLSDQIAVEYGPKGIRSNTLMPGVIRTEMHESVMEAMDDDRAFERELIERHPIGRFGTVEEVADAALFLCRAEGRFLTGANISIDGAYSRV